MAQAELFLLLNLFTLIGFGVAFLVIYHNKRRLKHALYFGVAWLACSGAFISDLAIRPNVPSVVGTNVSYLLFSIAIFYLAKGLYVRSGKFFPTSQYLILIAAVHAIITVVGITSPQSTAGALSGDYILGIAVLLLAIDMTSYRSSTIDKVVLAAVWFAAFNMLLQPTLVLFVLQEQVTEANYSDSVYAFIMYFSISLLSLPLSGSLMAATAIEVISKLNGKNMSDELTKLLNINAFDEISQSALETCRATNKDLSVAFVEIEKFDQIRAVEGKALSDYTLKLVADAIEKTCDRSLNVARVSDARFAVLMPSYNEIAAAEVVSSIKAEIAAIKLPSGSVTLRGAYSTVTALNDETFDQLCKRGIKALKPGVLCLNEANADLALKTA